MASSQSMRSESLGVFTGEELSLLAAPEQLSEVGDQDGELRGAMSAAARSLRARGLLELQGDGTIAASGVFETVAEFLAESRTSAVINHRTSAGEAFTGLHVIDEDRVLEDRFDQESFHRLSVSTLHDVVGRITGELMVEPRETPGNREPIEEPVSEDREPQEIAGLLDDATAGCHMEVTARVAPDLDVRLVLTMVLGAKGPWLIGVGVPTDGGPTGVVRAVPITMDDVGPTLRECLNFTPPEGSAPPVATT